MDDEQRAVSQGESVTGIGGGEDPGAGDDGGNDSGSDDSAGADGGASAGAGTLPGPNAGESRGEFLARCEEDITMTTEFPDPKERQAVCEQAWDSARSRSRPPEKEISKRLLPQKGAEVRARKDGDRMIVEGYGAVFNSLSEDLGGFREIIRPGAFRESLAEGADVLGLVDHDVRALLGRTGSGTMRVWEDDKGLWYEIDVPDTTPGRDAVVSIGRRDIRGSSFAFTLRGDEADEWNWEVDPPIRTLRNVDVWDTGPVANPAYGSTTSETDRRCLEEAKNRQKPVELMRRQAALDALKSAGSA